MGVLRTRGAPVGRPFQKGNPGGGRRKGVPNRATQEIKEYTRHFLQSETYRRSVERRILAGKAPQLETLFHHYAFGKPQVGLDPSGAASGPAEPAMVIYLPRNGREVEVDAEGRVVTKPPKKAALVQSTTPGALGPTMRSDQHQDISPCGAAVTTRGPATAHHLPQEEGRPIWAS